jgi:hypothetical protein
MVVKLVGPSAEKTWTEAVCDIVGASTPASIEENIMTYPCIIYQDIVS